MASEKNDFGGVITSDPYERGAAVQPTLDEQAIGRITPLGQVRAVAEGEVLFTQGNLHTEFILVLSGRLEVETDLCDRTEVVAKHTRGNFSGEIDMFSNRRALVRGVCREAGEMVFLNRTAFRQMLSTHADLSETIIRAFILRRTGLIYHQNGDLVVIGDKESGEVLSLRNFLSRNGHPHAYVNEEDDPALAQKLMASFDLGADDLPAVLVRNKEMLKRPSIRDLADAIGLSQLSGDCDVFDVGVIGMGPGGLAAAVNASAEGLSVVAFERSAPGGQAGTSSKIENYPAFPTGISGQALGARMMLQAQKFGSEILTPRQAAGIECSAYPYTVRLADGDEVKVRSIVIATGARWRRLGLSNEDQFENAGLYYGATAMEASRCDNSEVVVVGGGNSAGQAAIFLSRRARHVHILVRRDDLVATMSDYLIRRIDGSPNITVHGKTQVTELRGGRHLDSMVWTDMGTGQVTEKPIRHLFVMIGAVPNSDWLGDCVLLDNKGFVLTGADLPMSHLVSETWHVTRMPFIGETSQPGVFAVGDVRSGSVKRVASAVGEGAIAAQFLYKVVNPDPDA